VLAIYPFRWCGCAMARAHWISVTMSAHQPALVCATRRIHADASQDLLKQSIPHPLVFVLVALAIDLWIG